LLFIFVAFCVVVFIELPYTTLLV